jgi:methylmalonyl-CoA/ethylmalonyl-CoA epimerase
MPISLNRIGQIAFAVRDVDASEAFYRDKFGLRHLYRFGAHTFFDCCGARLMLEKASDASEVAHASPTSFACADIALPVNELKKRDVALTIEPHLIAKIEDHALFMAFFEDPNGNMLALMEERQRIMPRPPGSAWVLRSGDECA